MIDNVFLYQVRQRAGGRRSMQLLCFRANRGTEGYGGSFSGGSTAKRRAVSGSGSAPAGCARAAGSRGGSTGGRTACPQCRGGKSSLPLCQLFYWPLEGNPGFYQGAGFPGKGCPGGKEFPVWPYPVGRKCRYLFFGNSLHGGRRILWD